MKDIKIPRKIKLVVRPSHPALKIALTALIVFSMAALIALGWVHNAIAAQTDLLRGEVADVEFANMELEKRTEDPGALENVRAVAEEELGLVDPKTVVIDTNR